ncbi:Laminin subunit alpha-2 [Homalodisca vitripennis]|nr:Laminin subunit alpha-2 [Homalodisca vitripennis]
MNPQLLKSDCLQICPAALCCESESTISAIKLRDHSVNFPSDDSLLAQLLACKTDMGKENTQQPSNLLQDKANCNIVTIELQIHSSSKGTIKIQGLSKKLERLNYLLCTLKPTIIILTENGLNPNNLALMKIDGYYYIREDHRQGGVAVYIEPSSDLIAEQVNVSDRCREFVCEAAFSMKNNSLYMLGIYRPPSGPVKQAIGVVSYILNCVQEQYFWFADHAPSGTLQSRENFKGCIRNVKISGEHRDWTTMAALHNILLSSCPLPS